MRLYLIEGLCFFKEREEKTLSRVLSVALPTGSRLLLNEASAHVEQNGYAHIPAGSLREGENTLILCLAGVLYPVESLYRTGNTVRPVPHKSELLLDTLCAAVKTHEERILALEGAVLTLYADKNKKTLFS